MMKTDFIKLTEFIGKKAGYLPDNFSEETTLDGDMSIYGDDAVEIILAFGKAFDVDVSNFMLGNYFADEGGVSLRLLYRLFGKKYRRGAKELTIRNRLDAMIYKRLDEKIIALARNS